MKPQLLVQAERNGFVEKLHYGFILVIDEKFNLILKKGDDKNTPFPFRSGAKPLQASVVIDSGAAEYFKLDSRELAVICASHSGTKHHIEKIRNILQKAGLKEENLQCGVHLPLDSAEKERLIKECEAPGNLHNNCSGKHAGMLCVCVKNNWDINTYLEPGHLLQLEIMEKIKTLCALNKVPQIVYDGCSAPVPVLPHYNMGIGYLNLFLNSNYKDIKLAMSKNPYLAGGKERLDSEIMQASTLISKVAAEGLCIVVNPDEKKVLLVKIIDADLKARSVAVIDALKMLGWLTEKQVQDSDGLKNLYDNEIKDLKQKVVGKIKTVFSF